MPARSEDIGGPGERLAGGGHLVDRRDHRQQDPGGLSGDRLEQRPQLRLEQVRMGEAGADAANPERRVHLGLRREIGGGLVAADVERPEDDAAARQRLRDPAVDRALLVEAGRHGPAEEQQLRPDEADAVRDSSRRGFRLAHGPDVRRDLDRQILPSPGDRASGGDRGHRLEVVLRPARRAAGRPSRRPPPRRRRVARRRPHPGPGRAGSRALARRSPRGRSGRHRRGRCRSRSRAGSPRRPTGRDRRRRGPPASRPRRWSGGRSRPVSRSTTRRPTSRTSAARSRK